MTIRILSMMAVAALAVACGGDAVPEAEAPEAPDTSGAAEEAAPAAEEAAPAEGGGEAAPAEGGGEAAAPE